MPDAQALGPLKGLIQKAEQGFPERSATRFNLPGADALAEARAQSLDRRFFGRKAPGDVGQGLSGQGSQLRRGKNFFQKAASEFVVHLGKARHFGNIDAQSYDHDSTPGSLLTRRLPAEKN